ncbi:acyl-CoA dehydrogenase family protein [Streptomyces sp. NPDC090088]|uniref:acyl-CoA dehydrogenase family protein n=1 Tax=Streptomyces sp. NPDC090088 TaxID=3365944 RepID=UPI0038309031
MSLPGVALSADQSDIVGLVDAVVAHEGAPTADTSTDSASPPRAAVVRAGLWSMAVPEPQGGGGAAVELYLVALAQLGRSWPALAWAMAQTHAAASLLSVDTSHASVLAEVVSGNASACVVDTAAEHVTISKADEHRLVGSVARIDPCGENVHVLLVEQQRYWLLAPAALQISPPLARTGFAGARTASVAINGTIGADAWPIACDESSTVLAQLRTSGAAVAAGLAHEAAHQSTSYAQQRVQFGAPLVALPTVRQSLLRQLGAAASSLAATLAADSSDSRLAAAILDENCERAIEVAAAAVQSLGGYGYLAEYGVERLLRDAISLRAATAAAAGARSVSLSFAGSAQ